jgi:hypothetical protein
MDHIISEGVHIYEGTNREHTWLIYHDHLKIWWEKDSQEYLKSKECPIEGNPSRTWYERQIKISGETNNARVAKWYRHCLPGDSPELMPLDNHLFADLQEGAAKNVALTYHIQDGDPDSLLKYSFATPKQVYSSLQRTIKSGCPSPTRIAEDINRIFNQTLLRIIDAKGTYIEDCSKRSTRKGVRAQHAAAVRKRENLPVDAAATNAFNRMVEKMKDGGGVTFAFDLMGGEDVECALANTIDRTQNEDEGDGDGDGVGDEDEL